MSLSAGLPLDEPSRGPKWFEEGSSFNTVTHTYLTLMPELYQVALGLLTELWDCEGQQMLPWGCMSKRFRPAVCGFQWRGDRVSTVSSCGIHSAVKNRSATTLKSQMPEPSFASFCEHIYINSLSKCWPSTTSFSISLLPLYCDIHKICSAYIKRQFKICWQV